MTRLNVSELEALVMKYPYFTTAQVLLAVNMTRDNHEKAQQQLKLAAAMAPDRNTLRKLCIQLPDEYVVTEEDIDLQMAQLEEKKKNLDELMAIINYKIAELERKKTAPKKAEKKLSKPLFFLL